MKINCCKKNISNCRQWTAALPSALLCLFLALFQPLNAQQNNPIPTTNPNIEGQVAELTAEAQQQPIVGANVYWANSTVATTTDLNGHFSIAPLKGNNRLVISFIGYENDTLTLAENQNNLQILLHNGLDLQTIEIRAKQQGTFISELKPIKTEIISTQELRKAACCNLSESFETNASVEVNYADAVSGAKEIRMLGLDGAYSQILNEGIPSMRGLANTYGLLYVPGPWMHSIQITKGSGSVVNGYEPITGQINIEYKKPENSERLHLNFYTNHEWRADANANYTQRINKRWATMLLTHASHFGRRLDHNHDSFMDMPLNTIYTAMNRWKYQGEKMESMFGIKGVYDNRTGGQITFDESVPRSATDNGYGIGIKTKRMEAWAKTGFFFPAPYKSIGTMVSAVYHKQDMFFGLRDYKGEEVNFFANFIYQTRIVNCNNELKLGASYMYDRYAEQAATTFFIAEPNGLNLRRTESVPGAFVEYTRKSNNERFTLVLGTRLDYHNIYGLYYTPRMHLRYKLSPKTTLRASAGRGFRTTVLFAENIGAFANGRKMVFPYENRPDQTQRLTLKPEVAWNYGINLTQKFKLADREGFLSIDLYRTDFENQVIVDLFTNTAEIRFYNLNGKSFANSLQVETSCEILKGLDLKLAYKFDDVRSTYNGQQYQVPYQSRHKALATLSYETPNKHWRFDYTTQWHGSRQLAPLANSTQNENIAQLRSPDYFILNGQATFALKDWEFYVGAENLNNLTMHHPIANATQPFSNTFDATQIWGPIFGTMGYAGLRYTLK